MDPSPGTELTYMCPAGDRSGSSPDKNRALCMHICAKGACASPMRNALAINYTDFFLKCIRTLYACMRSVTCKACAMNDHGSKVRFE